MASDEVTDRRYRACCGGCSARIGSRWVAGFEGLIALTFLIFGIICQTHTNDEGKKYYKAAAPSFYTLTLITMISMAVLGLGLFFKKGWLLVLYMIKCAIFVVLLGTTLILFVMLAVTAGTGALAISMVDDTMVDHPHREAKETFMTLTLLAVIFAVVHGIFAILQIWFICVIASAYRAIRDAYRAGVAHPQTQMTVVTTTMPPPLQQPGQPQATTYYPSAQPSAPPKSYSPMGSDYPVAPPPYAEKE